MSDVCKQFLLLCSLSFQPLNEIFHRAKVFNFGEVQFIGISLLWIVILVSCLRTLHWALGLENCLMLFFKSLTGLHCIFKSMIYFELMFVKGLRFRLKSVVSGGNPSLPSLPHSLLWHYRGGPFCQQVEMEVSASHRPSLIPPWRWGGGCGSSLPPGKGGV